MTTNCSKFQPKQNAIEGHTNTHKKIMQIETFWFCFDQPRGGRGITSNTSDLDTQNTQRVEVRKAEKSPDYNSLFLLFHFQSISHIVNILVSAIENLFLSLGFYQLQLFSNCRVSVVRLLWQSPVTAISILVFAICSYVSFRALALH